MGWLLLGLLVGVAIFYGFGTRRRIQQWRRFDNVDQLPWGWRLARTSTVRHMITAYESENQRLLAQVQVWQQLMLLAPIGFLQVDEDNQLIFCNPTAAQLLGIDGYSTARPRLLLELVRSYELDALIEQTREHQRVCQSEWLLHPVDADFKKLTQQQSHPLRGYGIPMPNGCVAVYLESREESVRLAQQRDRWISDVAHELKTPLTSIRLVAETLSRRVEAPAREWVDRLLREAIRLGNLVQDLLDLNQLQGYNQGRLSLKTVDLVRLIHLAWTNLEPLASEKHLHLEYVGATAVLIAADETRIYRVALNLLDNAIKYSPAGNGIRVEVAIAPDPRDPTQSCVHWQVIDQGHGFPEETLPFVFDRFYRADQSRTRLSPNTPPTSDRGQSASAARMQTESTLLNSGNGLGLAIVQQIVEAHAGSVTASNHPETGGGWLQVFLPWSEDAE